MVALALVVLAGACGTSGSAGRAEGTGTGAGATGPVAGSDGSTDVGSPCGSSAQAPPTYDHVVVVMMENRTWSAVGGVGFDDPSMPYLHALASRCTTFADWTETDPDQNSLTQYIGLTSGRANPATVDDCSPSRRCRSTDDNLFRQVRQAGGTARTYVEGATAPCSAGDNAAKHVPALYYQGTYTDASGATRNDHDACEEEVRPLDELDVGHLPTFAMVVPDPCHDGHDCDNATVDAFARTWVGRILASPAYTQGTTAVMVLYDEDRPVPNLLVAPTAVAGPVTLAGAGHSAMLRTWEEMLGLPTMATDEVRAAPSLRGAAHL